VRDIDGDLLIDRSAFQLPAHDPAAFDQQPLRPYNAGPDALLVNLASLRFILGVSGDGKSVRVLQETPDPRVQIDNHLKVGNGECGDWREALTPRFDGWRLILDGRFAASCGEKELNLSAAGGDAQVDGLFRALWSELGGSLKGQVRSAAVPASASLLAYHDSPSLAEIVRDTNKFSNNVMARQLLIALSPAKPASPALGEKRLRLWLAEKGLSCPELVLENGSGLSRRERISAASLARLLAAAWKSPVMPEFIASLPILGRDGTLRRRLGQSAAGGRGHFKTGFLDNARALAGYQIDAVDRRWIVVALVNDANARAAKPAIDALIDWVANR
jgi:D-alanyl-D-alanine carboxypeptidase/D-alanyl-D-alanine-endopeptidase (penicillin-binding protein 4)